ncbi:phage tail tape measure protein [Dickeya oryzae]|uniref:Phage tail tape measure protein n=1 Tax=Dickeya oryzae TaxID=1240404 RepID=A0AB39ITG9_9GAMM|nr:phage tail tape measure protein [Dickeya oryzae]MBP2846331.1 phage tail tape measure protein [Dickeya oryzae]MCA6992664.1 phage tail tape measure protein [Dickeya oryzae]
MKSLDIRVAFSAIDRLTRPVNAARQSAGGLSESLKRTQAAIKDLDNQSRTFNRLRDSVQKTSRKIDEASRSLDGLKKAQQNNTVLTDKQREHMAALAAKLERLNVTRDQEMVKLRAASQALRGHGVSLVGSNATIQSAIRRTEQYNQTLERERRQLAAVTQARARYERMQQTAGKLRGSGTMAVAGGAAVGYAGGQFLAPAVGFDEEMSRVQALTRLDKGDQQLAVLRAQAKKLGAETAFTTRDAASGQAFLAMAGFTPQAIQAALPGVLNMALAGGMELGETADIGSNILSQFNLDASQMDRVGDVLTGTFTRTNTDLTNLGETMKYAGPAAAALGVSLEDAAAMAGMLANGGKKGSDAGTAMLAIFARLAKPPKEAADALKELGVSVADAKGKMRPMQDVLLDLFKTTKKYGQVDQLSFFKDIAGQEALVSLQMLVKAAGSGALGKLSGELKNAKGESDAVAKKMADNLGGDLKNLDSAWEGFRIQVEETADGPLRSLTQGLSDVITNVSGWVKENPRLTQTLLLAVGGAAAFAVAIGGTSLAIGLLMGPLAKLQLGFSVLLGARGVGGAVSLFSGLSSLLGGPMARMGGWLQLFSGSAGRLTTTLAPLRGMLLAAFISPVSALKSLGIMLFRLTGLPALFNLITGAVSILGSVLSFLLSPIGLIGAAFVAAGLLIWRFWEPIKAFFSGMFTGITQALTPLRDAFSRLAPIFDPIWQAVEKVWEWFKKLLEPIGISKESLDKCASAGEAFGRVLGSALELLLLPLQKLMEGIGWVLEKLGLIPAGLDAASAKAESLKKDPVMWEWDPQQKKMVQKGWNWSSKTDGNKSENTKTQTAPPQPLTGDSGTQRRLQKIADNTGGVLEETKKRIGPGDIVFKNLPKALAVRGEWQESRLTGGTPSAPSQPVQTMQALSDRPAVVAATQPVKQADASPVSRPAARTPAAGGFNGEIHIHLHGVERQDARELGRIVADAVSAELARRDRLQRGSFRDRE